MAYRETITIKGDYGKRLSDLLAARGLSQGDLAEATGLSRGLISRYISGDRTPYGETLKKIADALMTSPEYLMGESELTSNEEKTLTHAALSRLMSFLDEDLQLILYQTAQVFLNASDAEDKTDDGIDKRIKSAMEAKNWTTVDLAEAMGTTQAIVTPYVIGSRIPGKKVLESLRTALNIDATLLTGKIREGAEYSTIQTDAEKTIKRLPLKSQQVLYDMALRFARATCPEKIE